MSPPSETERRECFEWMRTRPKRVQEMMVRFPPGCIVKATRPLVCPAPGTTGQVAVYCERKDGSISLKVLGDDALLGGKTLAECDPEWLQVVEYLYLSPADVRAAIEAPQ